MRKAPVRSLLFLLAAIVLTACADTVTNPHPSVLPGDPALTGTGKLGVNGADCTYTVVIVHGDSTFTVTAMYPDSSAYCQSLKAKP
jgi:hypothetical protein